MKKRAFSIILILAAMVSLMPLAYAGEPTDDDYIGADITFEEAYDIAKKRLDDDAGKDLAQIASENNAIVWHYNPYGESTIPGEEITLTQEDSFDTAIEKLFNKYEVYKDIENEYYAHISLGYLNLVTGEEHYFNEDTAIVSASLFKVPENMIFCDKISRGEMSFDTEINGEPYSFIQYRTLSRSDNDMALALYSLIGGYIGLKKEQRAYIGMEPYGEDEYIDGGDIMYTPKNITYALNEVYNDQEKYNGIIQNMLQAQPYEYFKMFERDFVVAQKYGFISQTEATGDHSYINCCGIVFTDEPIAIVCMTDNISKAYDVIGEYACVASQYAQLHKTEVQPTPEPTAVPEETVSPQTETPSDGTSDLDNQTTNEDTDKKERKMSLISCTVIGLIIVVMMYFIVMVFRRNTGKEVNAPYMYLAIVLAALAMILCVIASDLGTLYAKPSGDPSATVVSFFDSIKAKDYQSAYLYLEDYSGLGLENTAQTEQGKKLQNALYESFDYSLVDDARTEKLTAYQSVMVKYLDLAAVEADAALHVEEALKEIVNTRDESVVFDEDHQYRQEILDEVYTIALTESLKQPDNFYTTKEIDITLDYVNGNWLMATSDELISLLMGGVSA